MTRKKQPDHIGFVLGELVGKKNWTSRFELHQVFTFWDEIVGPEVAAQAKPVKMHGTVLWVEVAESVWLQQLQYLKMAFVDSINNRFGHNGLTDIRFSLKQHRHNSADQVVDPPQPGPAPAKEDIDRFEKMIRSIGDDALRESISRCWATWFQYKDR
jgi:hypothetical protein